MKLTDEQEIELKRLIHSWESKLVDCSFILEPTQRVLIKLTIKHLRKELTDGSICSSSN